MSYPKGNRKFVSIIIAAKNESSTIGKVLNALGNQEYPKDLMEVIVADDLSTDGTAEVAEQYRHLFSSFKIVSTIGKELPGKKGALSTGISHAQGVFLLITDADCEPEPGWVQSLVDGLSSGAGIVFGIAPLKSGTTLASKLSAYENLRGMMLATACAIANAPYTAAARSMGFTRETYASVHGYSNTIETLSGDDDLLIREAVKHHIPVIPVQGNGSLVYSDTKSTFRDYLFQRARHTSTSIHYLYRHMVMLGCWHGINLLPLLLVLLTPLNFFFCIPLLCKFGFDITGVLLNEKAFGHRFTMTQRAIYPFLYEGLLLLHFIQSFRSKQRWK